MDQTAAQAELVTLLEDTLSQVSTDRLSKAITESWRDPWVAEQVWDTTSLTFSSTTSQYAIPSTMTTVNAIYYKRSSDLGPTKISSDLYEIIDGNIIFTDNATLIVPDGYTLQLRGYKKLAATDSISATNDTLKNYVIALAGYHVLKYMGYTRVLSFLRNDTTLSELIGFRNAVYQDMLNYRAQLQSSYMDS